MSARGRGLSILSAGCVGRGRGPAETLEVITMHLRTGYLLGQTLALGTPTTWESKISYLLSKYIRWNPGRPTAYSSAEVVPSTNHRQSPLALSSAETPRIDNLASALTPRVLLNTSHMALVPCPRPCILAPTSFSPRRHYQTFSFCYFGSVIIF